jgi:hypothetical protein
MPCNGDCNQGRNCNCGESRPLTQTQWTLMSVVFIIVIMLLFTQGL